MLRGLVLATAALMAVFFLYVAARRLFYPYEVEWMTGSILDHVDRVHAGQPLYVAPTTEWIPFLYPPLYYWVASALSNVMSVMTACRAISIVATLAQAVLVWSIVRQTGSTRFWAAAGVGMFFACYSYGGFWYDIERCDSLFIAAILGATLIVLRTRSVAGAAIAGALLGAAFFCKQPATFFVVGAAVGLFANGERKSAYVLLGVAAAIVLGGTLVMNAQTDGWFGYYVWKMPASHGLDHRMFAPLFMIDLPHAGLLVAVTIALGVMWKRTPVLSAMLAAAFFASVTSRLHYGGAHNVLGFWTVFACIALAVVATRIEAAVADSPWQRHVGFALVGAVLAQFALFAYNPRTVVPSSDRHEVADELAHLDGDVLVMGHGHLTAHRHFHAAALLDILRVERRAPDQIVDALARHQFSAIVLDDDGQIDFHRDLEFDSGMAPAFLENYFVSEQLGDVSAPLVGHAAVPTWVLRPRQTPLAGLPKKALRRRMNNEETLAQLPPNIQTDLGVTPTSIEDLARQIDEGKRPWPR